MGIATGVIPNMSSKGVCVRSVCRQLLCVNSMVDSILTQFSGLFMQKIEI